MPYALIIDVVVAILLVVTIIYAVGLNRRLTAMRRDRAKLEKIANDFAQSTARANDSITHLKSTNEALQRQLDTAQSLRDDLAYLLDRGEKSADRLEELVRAARDKVGITPLSTSADAPSAATVSQTSARETEVDGGQSEAEQALLRALRSAG
ncbi:MAG: DUF6468 domain-containing protein [Rhodospirillales bacterium]